MSKKVLVIDNYDSFTYNLVQYLNEIEAETLVIRNDDLEEEKLANFLEENSISHILISPGPGKPKDAKLSISVIKLFAGKLPILGVCLGHQAIAEFYGATVTKAPYLMHGKISEVLVKDSAIALFDEIPNKFNATRYHSLVVDSASIAGTDLEVTADTEDGIIMAIAHKNIKNLFGVQYHPESILSEYGHQLLRNFIMVS